MHFDADTLAIFIADASRYFFICHYAISPADFAIYFSSIFDSRLLRHYDIFFISSQLIAELRACFILHGFLSP